MSAMVDNTWKLFCQLLGSHIYMVPRDFGFVGGNGHPFLSRCLLPGRPHRRIVTAIFLGVYLLSGNQLGRLLN